LEEHPEVAVVSGRLRERYPEFSVYNRLCDIEWDTPVGETAACGGIAMMRARAFREVGGFDPAVIAGEEPELCLRLRAEGWKIWRLDAEMAFHDAAMTSFAQWWRRSQRTGYGYALGASLHSGASERLWRRQQLRAVFWGAVLPVITLGGSFLHPAALMLLFLYPLQLVRTAFRCRKLGAFSLVYASSMTIGKFAEMLGIIRFNLDRLRGRRSTIIEYKTGAPDDGDRGAFL
jgi:cellulose synthase/poly-beta-1,6-N-acetylglucosamine synthase-like glycosyltransferase